MVCYKSAAVLILLRDEVDVFHKLISARGLTGGPCVRSYVEVSFHIGSMCKIPSLEVPNQCNKLCLLNV